MWSITRRLALVVGVACGLSSLLNEVEAQVDPNGPVACGPCYSWWDGGPLHTFYSGPGTFIVVACAPAGCHTDIRNGLCGDGANHYDCPWSSSEALEQVLRLAEAKDVAALQKLMVDYPGHVSYESQSQVLNLRDCHGYLLARVSVEIGDVEAN